MKAHVVFVEIDGLFGVDDERLDPHAGVVGKGRSVSDVRGCVQDAERLILESCRVDTGGGDEGMTRLDIGGRIAQVSAAFVSVDHLSMNFVVPTEQCLNTVDLALLDRVSDPSRAYDVARIVEDRSQHDDFDASLGTQFFKGIRIAGSLVSKFEAFSHEDRACADSVVEDLVDEGLGGAFAHVLIELESDDAFEPAGLEKLEFLLGGGQPKLGRVRLEKTHRMGLECQYGRVDAELSRAVDDFAKDHAMPEVNSVEIPNRQNGGAQARAQCFDTSEDSHRVL